MGGSFLAYFVLSCLLFGGEAIGSLEDNLIDSCELSPILVPTLYDLKFDLDFPSKTFEGNVIISGVVIKETKVILLDSGVLVKDANIYIDQNHLSAGQCLQEEKTLKIEFEDILLPGNEYNLHLSFTGEIRNLNGIFGGNYSHSTGAESYFVATEFQPNYASYAFPCIDRPAYKAHFLLNISREADYVALSNMPRALSLPDVSGESKMWDSFEKTPLMSTYTFAFVVGKLFACKPEDNENTFNNTVWVTGEESNCQLASFASKWTPLYMKYLEKFTDVEYDLPKMDHVALPYLASTAMENWGLIMYTQEVILLNKTTHTVKSKFGLIWVLAHEMAHQWFGNLVTCTSWAYTWLNEGITSFLHFFISGKVFPEWDMLGLMMTEEVLNVMDDEGYAAVSLTKENCTMEASDTFAMPSYYKGAALMRMVYYMTGEEELKRGLQNYVKNNKYGCVSQEDLWSNFEDNKFDVIMPKNVTLGMVMKTWSNNYGFPLITVTRENGSIKLEQERLVFSLPDDLPVQRWWVPLSYTTSIERNFSKTVPRLWLNPDTSPTYLNVKIKKDDWIIFNLDRSGYYRVLYDNLTWAALTRQLKENLESIPPLSRAKLIDDVFSLTFYKKLHYSIPLSLSTYLTQETHYYPWSAAIKALEFIHFYLKLNDVNDEFEKFMLKLVEKVVHNLSHFNDYNDSYRNTNSRLLHGKILNFACNLRHKKCEKRAEDIMHSLLKEDENYIRMHVDEIYPLMCTMVRLGGQEIWDYAFEMYKREKVYKPKYELMEALKCTTDKNIWKKLTRSFLDKNKDYDGFDLYTTSMHDKKCNCYILEAIEEMLFANSSRLADLSPIIHELSHIDMPKDCSHMLKEIVEKYIETSEEKEEILSSIENAAKPWLRLKEIELWFAEESNKIDSTDDSSESGDNNLIERSPQYDGMMDSSMDFPYFPNHQSPQDSDNEIRSKHRQNSNINSSSPSLEFNLYILLFSVFPSPIYLTYQIFAPFI